MYKCEQKLNIDEKYIPWKERHKCLCYSPNKPEPFHFKVLAVNDAETGYMSSFFLYQGKAEQRPADISATLYPPIMKLLVLAIYKNSMHILATVYWNTSILVLIYAVVTIGAAFLVTVRANKKGLPNVGNFAKTGAN
jgi:hypothetical protein